AASNRTPAPQLLDPSDSPPPLLAIAPDTRATGLSISAARNISRPAATADENSFHTPRSPPPSIQISPRSPPAPPPGTQRLLETLSDNSESPASPLRCADDPSRNGKSADIRKADRDSAESTAPIA